MDITPLVRSDQQIIQSYAGGRFRVSGAVFDTSVIVFHDQTLEWCCGKLNQEEQNKDDGGSALDFKIEDFAQVIAVADALDVVLLGTGAKMEFIPPFLRQDLKDQGIMIEAMDTGAACRTYNVLMAEGRRVAAMLIPVDK